MISGIFPALRRAFAPIERADVRERLFLLVSLAAPVLALGMMWTHGRLQGLTAPNWALMAALLAYTLTVPAVHRLTGSRQAAALALFSLGAIAIPAEAAARHGLLSPVLYWYVPTLLCVVLLGGRRLGLAATVVVLLEVGALSLWSTPHPAPATLTALHLSGSVLFSAVLLLSHERMRMRAERREFRREQRLGTLLRGFGDLYFLHDAQGTLLDVNEATATAWQVPSGDLLGRNITDFDTVFSREAILAYMATAELGRPTHIETLHRRSDGTVFPVEIRGVPIEENGERVFLALARDLSAQRALEAQVRQAQKLEAVGSLAGGVAHEFNNLLQMITGYATLAQRDPGLNPRTLADLDEVLKATTRASDLTRGLSTFGKQQPISLHTVEVNALVEDTARFLTRALGQQVDLYRMLHPAPLPARLDRAMIEQVLIHLCLNARDAMPQGGRITLRTRPVTMHAAALQQYPWANLGDYVQVVVEDTGEGIAPDLLPRVFEPFFTTKAPGQGTGLGLSIAYGILLQHNGNIEVQSAAGQGSRFTLHLPAVR